MRQRPRPPAVGLPAVHCRRRIPGEIMDKKRPIKPCRIVYTKLGIIGAKNPPVYFPICVVVWFIVILRILYLLPVGTHLSQSVHFLHYPEGLSPDKTNCETSRITISIVHPECMATIDNGEITELLIIWGMVTC